MRAHEAALEMAAMAPRGWLRPSRPLALAWAPARLDVMGGIADYSGATVLELPLTLGVRVAAQVSDDGLLRVHTAGPAVPDGLRPTISVSCAALQDGAPEDAPERLGAALHAAGAPWAAYLLGPLAMLRAEGLLPRVSGLRLAAWSDVHAGAGISSSAALEVAALRAAQSLYDLEVAPLRLAALAQQAEQRVAGAPCGIMDQATALLGRRDHLLMLRCQPSEVLGQRRLPHDARVYGIDSGVAHRVGGGQYGRVRTAAFMGRAIITARDPAQPPGGYLCNLPPDRFRQSYAPLLPQEMRGADFLARYGETGDAATRVEPATLYCVRDCAAHPVYEQANVEAFLAALDGYEQSGNKARLEQAGAAMYASHDSYGARCGLSAPETDLIVELVRERGPARGLYGAKITGGGAGGTVAVLGAGPAIAEAVAEVAAEYTRRSGYAARVIAGSGDGALAHPVRRVMLDENGASHDL